MMLRLPRRTALLAGFLVLAWGFCPCVLGRALAAGEPLGSGLQAAAAQTHAPGCSCCRTAPAPHVPDDCPVDPARCPRCALSGCSQALAQPDAPQALVPAPQHVTPLLPLATAPPLADRMRHAPAAQASGPPRERLGTVVLLL